MQAPMTLKPRSIDNGEIAERERKEEETLTAAQHKELAIQAERKKTRGAGTARS
jgi:hypothetical protein